MKEEDILRPPPGWMPSQDIPGIVNALGIESPIGIEVGIDCGWSSEYLLENIPGLKLFGIDPYKEGEEVLRSGLTAYETMLHNTKKFGDKFIHIKKTSLEASEHFADESVDFVFVDGNHDYEYVHQDIEKYYPKIIPGGILFGHDYTASSWPGVQRAVNEWSRILGREIQLCAQDVWYWQKPL